MNTDFRVSVDFFSHHKARKLKKRLGPSGVLCLMQLWAYAAKLRVDGNLCGMSAEDVELAAEWDGQEGAFCAALCECGFLDGEDGSFSLHDWAENNPWVAEADARSERARSNAKSGWEKRKSGKRQPPGNADSMPNECGGNATAMQSHQSGNAPSPSPTPTCEEKDNTTSQGSTGNDNHARALNGVPGDVIDSGADLPGLEFLELRQFFDENIRAEGAESGFIEFKQLRASREWPGMDVVCDSILEHSKSCQRPEDRQYIPGLGRFLREKYWKRKPQPRASPSGTQQKQETQRQIAAALIAEDDRRNMHGHAQRDQNGSCQVEYRALPPP